MIKLLGLDVGDQRIGVAISEDKIIAPRGIISNKDLNNAIREIGNICRKEEISKIIVGLPHDQNPLQSDKIHKFAMELMKTLNLEVIFENETLTSVEAERILKNQNLNPRTKKYKEAVDKLAAQQILEQYLSQ